MADDQSTRQAQEQMAIAQLHQMAEKVIELGREEVGAETFDAMSKDVADAVGAENIGPVMASIVHTDAPQRIIQHLSENPDLAKSLAGMSQARRAQALGRIEAQLMPYGGGGGAEPAWFARARGEKSGLGDDLSDEQWHKNFQRKYPGGFHEHLATKRR